MAVDRNRLVVGSVAGLALVLVVWWQWPSSATTAAPQAAGTVTAQKNGARPTAAASSTGPVEVRLNALAGDRQEPGKAARNPFRYQPKAAPPPKMVTPVAPPPQPQAGPAIPVGPPPPPPIALKLIGVLERANGVKWAVLSDGKSAPLYGKDGDIIDGRYVIVKIGTESIEMTYADGRGRQMIRLSGQ